MMFFDKPSVDLTMFFHSYPGQTIVQCVTSSGSSVGMLIFNLVCKQG